LSTVTFSINPFFNSDILTSAAEKQIALSPWERRVHGSSSVVPVFGQKCQLCRSVREVWARSGNHSAASAVFSLHQYFHTNNKVRVSILLIFRCYLD